MTRDDLIAFEDDIAAEFNAGRIPHPVHLASGNEDALIEVFRDIGPEDWCLGGWRFHMQCLLHGVSRETLKTAIMRGQSMHLAFTGRRILCSSIVGGILPIAVGIAMGIKRAGGTARVHCWLGEMTAETGNFHECRKYACNHALPLRWIIEDNGISVCTDTRAVWNRLTEWSGPDVVCYQYHSKWPHAGAGQRVEF